MYFTNEKLEDDDQNVNTPSAINNVPKPESHKKEGNKPIIKSRQTSIVTQKISAAQLAAGKKVLGWSDSDEDTKQVSVFERRLKKAQAKQFAG